MVGNEITSIATRAPIIPANVEGASNSSDSNDNKASFMAKTRKAPPPNAAVARRTLVAPDGFIGANARAKRLLPRVEQVYCSGESGSHQCRVAGGGSSICSIKLSSELRLDSQPLSLSMFAIAALIVSHRTASPALCQKFSSCVSSFPMATPVQGPTSPLACVAHPAYFRSSSR